ncbi:MAG TPA: SH3 domain-containing protein, partial [Phototrophicaceae bacterium]|nr:SH3 domain-containing protein [Phototrophicaceae bacterium]
MTALVPLFGLVIDAVDGVVDTRLEVAVLAIAVGLIVFGILMSIAEFFRPQRLKQSRGMLTLGTGILLAFASIFVPLTGAYFSLPPRQDATPVAVTSGQAAPTPDAGSEFLAVFNQVIQVISDATGLSFDEVLTRLDQGQTVASLVSEHQGDLDQVINDITKIMQDFVRTLVTQNRIDPFRATAGIAGMEVVVRYAVNNDLSSLRRAGEEELGNTNATIELTPGEGTPKPSFFGFLTTSFTPSTSQEPALTTTSPAVTSTSTLLPTVTPPPTSQPSATRTPRPTATATRTRVHYMTPTPTLTETLPSPCVAVANFNVNLREKPSLDANLVVTIPYETVVNVFGRNEDSTWWFAEYEGQAGWIKGEFITLTSSCSKLPVRPVPR